jgi:hypothetical protein
MLVPFQLVASCRLPVICPLPVSPDSLLSWRCFPSCWIEQDFERFPWAYHVPVRFNR